MYHTSMHQYTCKTSHRSAKSTRFWAQSMRSTSQLRWTQGWSLPASKQMTRYTSRVINYCQSRDSCQSQKLFKRVQRRRRPQEERVVVEGVAVSEAVEAEEVAALVEEEVVVVVDSEVVVAELQEVAVSQEVAVEEDVEHREGVEDSVAVVGEVATKPVAQLPDTAADSSLVHLLTFIVAPFGHVLFCFILLLHRATWCDCDIFVGLQLFCGSRCRTHGLSS